MPNTIAKKHELKAHRIQTICVWLQSFLLLALLLATPFAMKFTAFDRIFLDGAWGAPQSEDPLHSMRVVLVLGGLAASVTSFQSLLGCFLADPANSKPIILSASLALSTLSVGWKNFPYWVNGVYQAYIHNQGGDFDPKALMPMTWIGEFWRFGVILLYMAVLLVLPILIFFAIKIGNRWLRLSVVGLSFLTILCFYYAPNYLSWLMD